MLPQLTVLRKILKNSKIAWKVLTELPRKDIKIITGEFNTKVGSDDGCEAVMGRYGYGQRNARGERLLEFTSEYGHMQH